ncbi:TonB-dependent receptor domain-containing protein [Pseudomonas sp. MYb185]|uniref:TonB-dependent receptor domain-containing protein n=1 Tax=Pseudomonas sp. MYb185 TaxID=1848729 RepID=UPI000CFB5C03|nr:TonB-dependent receptor [Pseudomonas sp. MYb185]PRB78993.1 TonB-dependent receptor [Pseudomonas sp. MYb185]
MSRSKRPFARTSQPQFKKTLLAVTMASVACSAVAQQSQEALDLGQTVVTASGFEQNLRDAPAAITVISQEELKKKSYTDITDALKNVAGVQISGGGVEQSIMMRGMTSAYTLFLIDGRPAQGNDAFSERGSQAGTPINFLPPLEAIERIEVIRGPASALYGSDAMGGVINIITKKVGKELTGSITAEYAMAGSGNDVNEDGFQTSAFLNMPLIEDVLGLQLTGAFQNQDESNLVGLSDSAATDPEYKKRNAGGKLSWNLNEQNLLTFGHSYTKQERWKNPGRSIAEEDNPTYAESIKKNYFLAHEGKYGNVFTNSYINYDHSENATTLNANTGKGIEFEVITANTQASWFLGAHTLTGGLTHKYENLEHGSNGLREPVVPDADAVVKMNRYQNSIFLEDNWSLTDDLILTLSGRLDDNQAFGSEFSPKVYAVWHMNDNFTLKGGVTSGYKAPDLRSSATDFGSTSMGGVIIGNPDLTPETSLNREIALHYENFDIGLAGSVTAYVTEYKDKINRTGRVCEANEECYYNGTYYPPHQYGYTAYENVDKAELRGIEFTLDYDILDNLTYRHSYTYTETEQKSGEYKGEPLNDVAKHMFNASLDWQATQRVNLWVQGNYRGKTSGRWQTGTSGSNTNGIKYPSYTFADAGVMFRPQDDLSLKAGIYNLTNKKVTTDGNYAYNLDGRRLIFALTKSF